MNHSKAQIVATIGPSSFEPDVLRSMLEHQMDVARLNLSWGTLEEKDRIIKLIRKLSREIGKHVPIILDLPGPRVQEDKGHCLDEKAICAITEDDKQFIKFASEQEVEYLAVSFVGGPKDIDLCREIINSNFGKQKIIAKIERREAIDRLEEIIKRSDALMVARGDLGNEIPFEQVPFVQDRIVKASKGDGKPVIVATEMLLSMINNSRPTRAEVTDVANAILGGADAVMLSEETTMGKYPVETVMIMEKIVLEAEKHLVGKVHFNHL